MQLSRNLQAIRRRLDNFLFPEVSDNWMTVLRIGLSVQVLIYCISLLGDWKNLFLGGSEALVSRDLEEAILKADSPGIPRIGWLVMAGKQFGLAEETVLWVVWAALFLAGLLLLLGLFCRASAIVAWLFHLCAVKSSALLAYGVDNFTTIGLFYLAVSPLPDRLTLDHYLWPKTTNAFTLGFFQRVLQLHLCVIYFFGGLTKFLGTNWWNGISLWRSLTCPPFNILPLEMVLKAKEILPAGGIAIWLLELGYPFFIWPKRTRFAWLGCILGMHIAIGLTMGLYLFALIMIVLNLAAFGTGLIRWPKIGSPGVGESVG
jgi:uncharacterized membrane protein YphA (DoxX/SURF4 family)